MHARISVSWRASAGFEQHSEGMADLAGTRQTPRRCLGVVDPMYVASRLIEHARQMWNDPHPLLEVLDCQFKLVLEAKEQRRLMLLPKLLATLERDPVISSLLLDLRQEGTEALDNQRRHCAALRNKLREAWSRRGASITSFLDKDKDRGEIDAYWDLSRYDEGLRASDDIEFPETPIQDSVPGDDAGKLLRSLHHWVKWCRQRGNKAAWLKSLAKSLNTWGQEHERAVRTMRLATEALGWCAFVRLHALVERLDPEAHDLVRLHAYREFREVAFGSRPLSTTRDSPEQRRVRSALEDVTNDCRLLHDELRTRLLLGLSRRSVLNRYGARCEAFRAESLRELAETSSPEAALTLDLAAYLFDCGFAPIIDPKIGRLRPDIIDVSRRSLFYVEAKQYNRSPRSTLEDAYFQVWSTWMRLEKQYSLPEGFLVVFRRDGPLVELPSRLDFGGRRLHSILVDISPSAGSKERLKPIKLDPARLIPVASGRARRGSARTRTDDEKRGS